MNHVDAPRRKATVCLLATLLLTIGASVRSEEPFDRFLDELRRREMFDVALEYLAQMRTSPVASAEIKQRISYEEARTLVQGSSFERDFQLRVQQLDQARAKFEEFIAAHQGDSLAATAGMQLGNVLVARGRTQLERSRRGAQAANRDALVAEARQLFGEARDVFARSEQEFQAQVASFPTFIDREHAEQIAARDAAQRNLMQAKLLKGQVQYELAQTHANNSEPFRELLTKAAATFGDIYENYRVVFGGLYARMWQGRCLQELGDNKQALSYYAELLAQPDEPAEFRNLKAQTLRLSMMCWLEDGKLDETIRRGQDWLQAARGSEDRGPEGVAIRWLTASALDGRATEVGPNDPRRQADRRDAEQLAEVVARIPGEFQQPAKAMLARLRNVELDSEPTTFADARDAGSAALDQAESARSAGEPDDQVQSHVEEAIRSFKLALDLRDDETSLDEINQVRYYLSYLYFRAGRNYDAAVMGEFLARRYPDSAGARPGARIAMIAYLQSYNAAPPAERQFDAERMASVAAYLAEQWPDQPEAAEAWMQLGNVAIRSGDFERAADCFAHVPEESPFRAEANLKSGQALWNAYLSKLRAAGDDPAARESLEPMVRRAEALLDEGIATLRAQAGGGAAANDALLRGELARAKIHLAAGEFDRAIGIMQIPQVGLLAQLEGGRVDHQADLALEIRKTAVVAYVGNGTEADLAEAMQMVEQLEAAAGTSAGDQAELRGVYVSVARELESRMTQLREAGKQDALRETQKGFEAFIGKIAEKDQGAEFGLMNWIAESYYSLGSGLTGQGRAGLEAKNYFQSAADTYGKILAAADRDASFLPNPHYRTSLMIRQAQCLRHLGRHDAALDVLVEILKTRPATVEAQTEAALVYEDWGSLKSDYYANAIGGGRRVRKTDGSVVKLVWGWTKLAAIVQRNPQMRSLYHQARFHLAQCYFGWGNSPTADDKDRYLELAEVAITSTARLDPEMGGDEWKPQYDALLKRIQRARGRQPTGLEAVVPRPTSATAVSSGGRR